MAVTPITAFAVWLALRPLLPTWPLTWHYRSRDERLVAFSNAHIYGGSLTTLGTVRAADGSGHVRVRQHPRERERSHVDAALPGLGLEPVEPVVDPVVREP